MEEIDSKCQLHNQLKETNEHLTLGCTILTKTGFNETDKLATHLHYSIYDATNSDKKEK
jgi:hypothetical protein